jgi:hypothetical protein
MTDLSTDHQAFFDMLSSLTPGETKDMIDRRHPEYAEHMPQWHFLEATYKGGREWFSGNIFRYIKEGEQEYQDRLKRGYRFNHTRETVDLLNKYIFKGAIARKEDGASAQVVSFWTSTTLSRRPIIDFMKMVATASSVYGRIWVCTDTNQTEPNATLLSQKASGARVYAYTIKPQHVLDLAYNIDGDLTWIKIEEHTRDDATIVSEGAVTTRFRIWTQQFWAVYTETSDEKGKVTYELADHGEHGLGVVPLFPVDHTTSDNPYIAPGMIDEIAYLDRAVANYLSNLDAIIQDQTFSQLVMPAQSMLPGTDGHTTLLSLGMKRIFTYDAQGGQAPQYISPDASQAGVILSVVNKIISEIYHSIGMAGERTKQDNSMGIDNSSGVAKAYDFDRMNAMLTQKARALEVAENRLCELVDIWFGETVEPGTYALVKYPDNFDVRGLYDEIDLAEQLLLVQAPPKMRQQQMEALVDKLFPNLADALISAMKTEITTSWPPVEVAPTPTSPTAGVQEKRQGQTTKTTGTTKA